MNKRVLKWVVILLVAFALGWVFLNIVSVKETKVINTKDTGDILNDPNAGKILDSAAGLTKQDSENKEIFYEKLDKYSNNSDTIDKTDSEESYVDLTELRKGSNNGVRVVSVNDSNFDVKERREVLKAVNNLKMLGSMSGGQITHEFSDLNLKRGKIEQEKTSFEPTDNILAREFEMTSRVYSGAYSQDSGYNSVYRLYENSSNGAKIEFTEMYLDPKNNSVMEVVEETLNHSVNNVPMTFETIKTKESGTVYNAQFNVGEKYYSFSTQGISSDNFENILSTVIEKEKAASTN